MCRIAAPNVESERRDLVRETCAWPAVAVRVMSGGVRCAGRRSRAANQFGRKTARTQSSSCSRNIR
jgi:hypothetical protein